MRYIGEDLGINYWRDLIESKQLPGASECPVQVFAGFSGHSNSIYNILNTYKENTIGSKYGLQTTSESSVSISECFLV